MPYSAPLKKGDGMAIHVRAFLPHFLLSLLALACLALGWGGVGQHAKRGMAAERAWGGAAQPAFGL